MCCGKGCLFGVGLVLAGLLVVISSSVVAQELIAFLSPISLISPFFVDFDDPTYGAKGGHFSWVPHPSILELEFFGQGITPHRYTSILNKKIQYVAEAGERVSIGAWDLLTAGPRCSKEEDVALNVLYSHGNAENRGAAAHRYDALAEQFAEAGHCGRIVTYDYRGFADSSGIATEENLAEDARNVMRKAELPPERTILFGHSLGTVVSFRLAIELARLGTPPAAVVLEAPLTHAAGVCAAWIGGNLFEDLTEWLEQLCSSQALVNMSTIARMQEHLVDFPVFIFHGVRDWTVPHSHGEMLHDACKKKPTRRHSCEMYSFPEAGHLNVFYGEQKVDVNGMPSTQLLRQVLLQVIDGSKQQ